MQGGQQIINDKFLVQLTKTSSASAALGVRGEIDRCSLQADALANLWKPIAKEAIVQYKMRVDIHKPKSAGTQEQTPKPVDRLTTFTT